MRLRSMPYSDPAVDPNPVPAGPREETDDFYCLRYTVWYGSFDCAYRSRFHTAPGCRNCEQGRFNLKRHARELARVRPVALAVV